MNSPKFRGRENSHISFMKHKPQTLALFAFIIACLGLFIIYGVNATTAGPSYTHNCNDTANLYLPCTLHDVEYGIPFRYAEGHPYIPGNSYSRVNVQSLPLVGNFMVWVVLPSAVCVLVAKRK